MRSRADIQAYQRAYYLLCMKVDPDGMRKKWREARPVVTTRGPYKPKEPK